MEFGVWSLEKELFASLNRLTRFPGRFATSQRPLCPERHFGLVRFEVYYAIENSWIWVAIWTADGVLYRRIEAVRLWEVILGDSQDHTQISWLVLGKHLI